MSDGAEIAILVCSCGERLRAPNARPGRVGRCPKCGETLRFEGTPRPEPDPPPAPPDPRPRRPPEDEEPPLPERLGDPSRKPGKRRKTTPIGREGIVRAPKAPETALAGSFAYPLWDGNGVTMLACLPPALTLMSLLSIGLVPTYILGDDEVTRFGAFLMAAPMLLFLLMTLGYVLLFLTEGLRSSAFGDTQHPRVPPWQTGPVLASLFRGLWAGAFGTLLSAPLIALYLSGRQELQAKDWAVMALLSTPGLAYAQLALIGVSLHESFVAANPATVLSALTRAGIDSFRVIALAMASAVVGAVAFLGLFLLPGIPAVILGTWVFWVATLYLAMVVCRVLGLFYRKHSEAIGWFPDRPRWGA